MLVSVVAPLFNHEPFALDCLMSIVDQTWPDIELIVLDDVSRDRSFELAKTFARTSWVTNRFKRLVVERNVRNLGAAATINRAISLSSGEVVMVINSDDLYAPMRVTSCIEAIASGRELVFLNVEFIDGGGCPIGGPRVSSFRFALDDIERYPSISASFLQMNRAISTGNLCFTRRLYDVAGPFMDLKYCHDWDFVLMSILETEPAYINDKLYYYRLHETNSFITLELRAEPESRSCLERYFNRIVCGSIANPTLRAVVGCDMLWDGLIAQAGPVVAEEWRRAREGKPARAWPEDLRRDELADFERKSIPAAESSVLEMLGQRCCDPILVTKYGGEVYADGWIGNIAEFRVRVPRGSKHLATTFFVPPDQKSKTVISRVTWRDQPLHNSATRIEPGQTIDVVFGELPSDLEDMNIYLTVAGCERTPPDLRDLGIVIIKMRSMRSSPGKG